MPPRVKRNCQVILYDLNTNDRELTKRCLLKYYCTKLFTRSKDLHKLILLNAKTTKNRLNSRYNTEYLDIYETMKTPTTYDDPKWIDKIIDDAEVGESDWLEAVYLGFKSLTEDFGGTGNLITLQLILLTDFVKQRPSKNPGGLLEKILSEFKEADIFFYIIGPNSPPPFIIKEYHFIKKWMKELTIPTINQTNFKIIKQLVTQLDHCVCCDYKVGLNLLEIYKNFVGKQPWNVPISVGDIYKLSCQTRRLITQGRPCKITKKRQNFKQSIWVDAEDSSIKYAPDDIIVGIERHGKFVPINDNKRFNSQTFREFTFICFCKCTDIPEHYMNGDTYCVQPPDDYLTDDIINSMARNDLVMILRRVYNKNHQPKYVGLIPKPDLKCLLLVELPYSHEACYHYKESPAKESQIYKNTPNDELIFNFLDSINCTKQQVIEKIPLSIHLLQDPYSARLINKAADKLLDKHLRLDELDFDYLNTNLVNNPFLDELKKHWPERESGEKRKLEEIEEDDDFNFK